MGDENKSVIVFRLFVKKNIETFFNLIVKFFYLRLSPKISIQYLKKKKKKIVVVMPQKLKKMKGSSMLLQGAA